MEKVISIVEEFFVTNKNVKIIVRKEKIIISHRSFYSIILNVGNSDKINICPIWRIGPIGRLLCNRIYKDHIDNYNSIKNLLVINGYVLSELHVVGNSMEFSFCQIFSNSSLSSTIKFK